MSDESAGGKDVSEYLSRLKHISEDGAVDVTTYSGRALSRSDSTLRLSVETGVISIPLEEVRAITPLGTADPTLVKVEVGRVDEVKHVVRAEAGQLAQVNAVREMADSRLRYYGPIILGGDTATVTGGRFDATDDTIVIVHW